MVDSATPWAVWVRRLPSYRTFWLAHPPGRCTRVASPSTHTASPTSVISANRSRRFWVGFLALFRGFSQIFLAFGVRHAGHEPAAVLGDTSPP